MLSLLSRRFGWSTHAVEPRIAARIAAGARRLQARQVVIPPVPVALDRLGRRQVAMREAEQRALAVRLQLAHDGARPRRHGGRLLASSLPAPGVDEPARRVGLEHLTAD